MTGRKTILIALILVMTAVSGCAGGRSETAASGYALIESKDYTGAMELLYEAVQNGEESSEIYRALGIAQMGAQDYDSAAASFEAALSRSGILVSGMDIDVNKYLAACYYKTGRIREAVAIYDAILAIKPRDTDVYESRGVAKLAMNTPEEADADFRAAMELEPKNYQRLIRMRQAMLESGHKEMGQAYLSEAIARDPDMSAYDRGRLSYYLEDYQTAKNELESIRSENDFRTILMLGQTYEALGDLNYAADVYEGYLTQDQSHAEIYNQLGICRLSMGDAQAALTAFQAGQSLHDENVMKALLFNEICAYEELGEFQRAGVLMQNYLSLYPEDSAARREMDFLSSR